MKKYAVVFDPAARQEMMDSFKFIADDSPHDAEEWLTGLKKSIHSLA